MFENELDEDDHLYKEAIPPAPKLQGTLPRSDTNATQGVKPNAETDLTLIENQKSFGEGNSTFSTLHRRFNSLLEPFQITTTNCSTFALCSAWQCCCCSAPS